MVEPTKIWLIQPNIFLNVEGCVKGGLTCASTKELGSAESWMRSQNFDSDLEHVESGEAYSTCSQVIKNPPVNFICEWQILNELMKYKFTSENNIFGLKTTSPRKNTSQQTCLAMIPSKYTATFPRFRRNFHANKIINIHIIEYLNFQKTFLSSYYCNIL